MEETISWIIEELCRKKEYCDKHFSYENIGASKAYEEAISLLKCSLESMNIRE